MDFSKTLLSLLVPAFILVVGIVDDLRFQKIRNKFILFFIPFALISMMILKEPSYLYKVSLFSCLWALVFSVPLYLAGFFGAGDVKLFFAVSLAWTSEETIWSFIYSLPLSLLFGILKIIFQGKIQDFLKNLMHLIQFKKIEKEKLQTFPYSVVLLLGWMTFKVLEKG